jgi:hypothetical protein
MSLGLLAVVVTVVADSVAAAAPAMTLDELGRRVR